MHIILTGATGTVGSAVLQHCLASSRITRLSILSRRQFTLPIGDDLDVNKARVIVHEDYTSYPDALLKSLQGAEGCIWAQGISQTQVSKEEYIKITYDYPIAAARSFATLASNARKFNFVYVSGEGADPNEKAWTLFGKIKGRAEKDLLALPSSTSSTDGSPLSALRIFNVRPGFVDPQFRHTRGAVFKRFLVDGVTAPIVRTLMPSQVSPTGELSKVLEDLATGDGEPIKAADGVEAGGRTIRCSAVRRMAAT